MALSHKDMTKHFRGRLKHAKIKARCNKEVTCGVQVIRISAPQHDVVFSNQETIRIYEIAMANKLTGSRGSDLAEMRDLAIKHKWERNAFVFEYHGEG